MNDHLKKEDVLKLMRSFDFFQPFDERELDLLYDKSKIEHFSEGARIIEEGTNGKAYYVILKGSVIVRKKAQGTPLAKDMNELGRGSCFGEMSIVTGKPRSADVIAKEETFAFKLVPDFLEDTNDVNLPIQLKLYKNFSRGLAEKLEKHGNMVALLL